MVSFKKFKETPRMRITKFQEMCPENKKFQEKEHGKKTRNSKKFEQFQEISKEKPWEKNTKFQEIWTIPRNFQRKTTGKKTRNSKKFENFQEITEEKPWGKTRNSKKFH